MRDALAALVDAFAGRAAIFARHLTTGDEVVMGEVDRRFPTGSAAKALVLLAYAAVVEAGDVDPHERVELEMAYREARKGSGVLRFLEPGLNPTLEDCAWLMMTLSDNVATDLLLDRLGGPDAVNGTVGDLGVAGAKITSPTVWVIPPGQFGMGSPRGLAGAWELLHSDSPVAARCRTITWRQQHREGFGRLVPFSPDLPDFGLESPLGLWSKPGAYPSVSCEAGLFETAQAAWTLAVMAEDVADWGNGCASAGPTLRAEASRIVYGGWSTG